MQDSKLEEKLKYKKRNKFVTQDIEFIKRMRQSKGEKESSNYTSSISQFREKLAKAIKSRDASLLDDASDVSLDDLMKTATANNVKIPEGRKQDWKKFEKDVVDGLNKLFNDKFFTLKKKDGTTREVTSKDASASGKGGPVDSDVKVTSKNGKSFFIECKLNYDNAEYLKFRLKATGEKLKYDNEFFLRGLDQPEKEMMSELFSSAVNVNKFLESVLSHKEVNRSWIEFNLKLIQMHNLLDKSEEFSQFSKQTPFERRFPDLALSLAKVFDLYCNHYITKYNQLINEMFSSLNDPDGMLDKNDYIIKSRSGVSDVKEGEVFKSITKLIIDAIELDASYDNLTFSMDDEDKFISDADQIKTIEAKIFGIMKHLSISNPNDLLSLSNKVKLQYFFKAFMSSSLRKSRDSSSNEVVPFETDDLGNMQVCSQVEDDFPEL